MDRRSTGRAIARGRRRRRRRGRLFLLASPSFTSNSDREKGRGRGGHGRRGAIIMIINEGRKGWTCGRSIRMNTKRVKGGRGMRDVVVVGGGRIKGRKGGIEVLVLMLHHFAFLKLF